MHQLVIFCLLSITCFSYGQTSEYVYKNPKDSTFNCYLKIYPETKNIRGLVVRDYTNLPDTARQSPYQFQQLCSQAGLMTLYTNTSNSFPELFESDLTIKRLDEMILEVVNEHNIPADNIFIGGISASGARALRYAEYCAQGKSTININGAFAVDSPLDLARFYTSIAAHRQNFKAGMLEEADFMPPVFHKLFGGGPDENYEGYKSGSVFTHSDSLGGNAVYLKSTAIILFHEPDIDWWLEERGASYYDINSYDLAAFTALLRQLGNENVELITTTGKGFDRAGDRRCHSWTIVDDKYLVNWIKGRLH